MNPLGLSSEGNDPYSWGTGVKMAIHTWWRKYGSQGIPYTRMNSTQVNKYVIMTTPTSTSSNTAHNIHYNVRSVTLPHVDCYSRLRASPRVFSELGYRPTRCRYAHQAVSLPQKGWVGLPAYRHPPPTSLE